jgi:hypothetical protein
LSRLSQSDKLLAPFVWATLIGLAGASNAGRRVAKKTSEIKTECPPGSGRNVVFENRRAVVESSAAVGEELTSAGTLPGCGRRVWGVAPPATL